MNSYPLFEDVLKCDIQGKAYYCANIVEKQFDCNNVIYYQKNRGNYKYCLTCYDKWNRTEQKPTIKGRCLIQLDTDNNVSLAQNYVPIIPIKPKINNEISIPKKIVKKVSLPPEPKPEPKPIIVKKVLKKISITAPITKECSDCKENDRSWSTSLNYKCNNERCENCNIKSLTVCCNCMGEYDDTMEFDMGYCMPCSNRLREELEQEQEQEIKYFPIFYKKKVIKKI
jgi:hypothetical protein